jgi:acyl-CoA synthetase (AMP-forming)/AMP-acid ligase II
MNQTTRLLRKKDITVASLLDEMLPMRGNRIVSYHENLTGLDGSPQEVQRFDDLHREIDILGRFLVEGAGLRRGERVAIFKTNDPRCFRWFMAIIRAGGVAVPLNPLLTLSEVHAILNHCGVRILITDSKTFTAAIHSRHNLPVTVWIQSDAEPLIDEAFLRISGEHLEKHPFKAVSIDPDETIAIFHTSGTSGVPKGAMLSSRSLLGGASTASLIAPFIRKKELALFTLPWAHIMAVSTALYGLIAGIPALFLERFETERVIDLIEQRRITSFIGVPAMFIKLVNASPPPERLAGVRLWVSASDHLPIPYRRRLLSYGALYRILGRRIVPPVFINIYGMVELGGSAMIGIHVPAFPGSGDLCFPVPPFRIRIVDDKGNTTGNGQVGECQVQGPGVTRGYWNNPDGTSNLITDDGWLRTGDLALRNRFGLIRIMGRSKDMIKCGGYSVFAADVEEVLASHPAIARASVLGVPHEQKGEVPVGFVEMHDGLSLQAEEILAWCRCRLAPYKTPRSIHIMAPGEIPRGVTEKVLKQELLKLYQRDFYHKKDIQSQTDTPA